MIMRKLIVALFMAAMSSPAAAQDATADQVIALSKLQSATSPSLSPDGKRMAYLSDASGSPQVWMRDMTTGTAKQVTDLPDSVGDMQWSPKGDWIAYTVAPGGGLNSQIWVMKPDGRDAKRLTAGGKENNNFYGWTPDGTRLMVATNRDNPAVFDVALIEAATGRWQTIPAGQGYNQMMSARRSRAAVWRLVGRGDDNVYFVDLVNGKETLATPHTGKAQNWWGGLSHDGRTLYLTSGIGRDLRAFGTVTIGADGRAAPIDWIAARDDAMADNGLLAPDGRLAALLWNAGGRNEITWLDTASRRVRPGPKLPVDILSLGEFSADGRALFITGSSADRTTDIYKIDIRTNAVARVTHSRHDGVDLASLARPELIHYEMLDGVKLSGWLYRPRGKTGPMPLVFSYHGGPEGQARPTLNADAQALVASGIAVFTPNVRGSSGFGKAFMAMDDGAKRVNSVADIKASTDALVGLGIADPKRLGIMGGSYGGYMVMAGITEYPDMFAAGADLYGVVNFESFFRNTEPWIAAISTTEYGDPVKDAAMLKSLSPIHKLDMIKTPLFVLHGANDTNVPVAEAEQIVASLRARGVPVKYTLFPDEGHGWSKTAKGYARRPRSSASSSST